MFKILLFLTLFAATTSSCMKENSTPSVPTVVVDTTKPPPAIRNLRYLALGDSYTIGERVAENERFPNQLADALAKQEIYITNLRNIARTGWTTDELQTGIAAAVIADSTFDMVSLLIGVNNQYRGRSKIGRAHV